MLTKQRSNKRDISRIEPSFGVWRLNEFEGKNFSASKLSGVTDKKRQRLFKEEEEKEKEEEEEEERKKRNE